MKNTTIILSALIIFLSICSVKSFAQNSNLDKETKKELKSYIKNPDSYRRMIKNYDEQIEGYEVELNEVKEDYYKADYLRIVYYDSIQALNAKIDELENQSVVVAKTGTDFSEEMETVVEGIDFRVQIGAYRLFDFTELLKFGKPIGYENVDGIIHYYLGSWNNPYDANDFAVAMRKLNIKGAFVTKYEDGTRIPFDYLLEASERAMNE